MSFLGWNEIVECCGEGDCRLPTAVQKPVPFLDRCLNLRHAAAPQKSPGMCSLQSSLKLGGCVSFSLGHGEHN